jgi:hypothetical protein
VRCISHDHASNRLVYIFGTTLCRSLLDLAASTSFQCSLYGHFPTHETYQRSTNDIRAHDVELQDSGCRMKRAQVNLFPLAQGNIKSYANRVKTSCVIMIIIAKRLSFSCHVCRLSSRRLRHSRVSGAAALQLAAHHVPPRLERIANASKFSSAPMPTAKDETRNQTSGRS